jgi:hypothetical protein
MTNSRRQTLGSPRRILSSDEGSSIGTSYQQDDTSSSQSHDISLSNYEIRQDNSKVSSASSLYNKSYFSDSEYNDEEITNDSDISEDNSDIFIRVPPPPPPLPPLPRPPPPPIARKTRYSPRDSDERDFFIDKQHHENSNNSSSHGSNDNDNVNESFSSSSCDISIDFSQRKRRRLKDSFQSLSQSTLTRCERWWNSDHSFIHLAVFLCIFFGVAMFSYGIYHRDTMERVDTRTILPTLSPSLAPSSVVTSTPTKLSNIPSLLPTEIPTKTITLYPSIVHSEAPSHTPSLSPTIDPTLRPSPLHSMPPSNAPSISTSPSSKPSSQPSSPPSTKPTISSVPTVSFNPTSSPTEKQCSCSPRVYYLQLDFDLGCPLNVTDSRGIQGQSLCGFSKNQQNVKPIVVTEVSIKELAPFTLEVKKEHIWQNETLLNGASIRFVSLSDEGIFLGGLEGRIKAINAEGEFENFFKVEFSNTCEILPFNVGDSLGFLVFVSVSCLL